MYSPFQQDLEKLTADDLLILKTVSEGWFVEYKEQLPNPSTIAKSVSAFANHQGGWLFIGVTESGDGHRTADAFPGVDAATVSDGINRIRDAVKAHTSPVPHFEVRALVGPSGAGDLANHRAVLVVRVPPGENTPYLHSSGRIYRRMADSSEPAYETDRAVLDLLVDRSRRARRQLKRFLTSEHVISEAEKDQSYAILFLMQDLLGEGRASADLTFHRFAEIAGSTSALAVDLALENAFTMAKGYVARQVGINDRQYRLLTWEFYGDGASVFTIPLTVGDPRAKPGYERAGDFANRLRRFELARVIDSNLFMVMLAASVGKHRAALDAAGLEGPTFAKVKLANVWRKTPFIDSQAYLEHVTTHGLPICQYRSTFAPPSASPESFLEIAESRVLAGDTATDRLGKSYGAVASLFAWIMEALGVPREALIAVGPDILLAATRSGVVTHSSGTGP